MPWEDVILLANAVNRDVWINVPVTASSPTVKGTHTPSDKTKTCACPCCVGSWCGVLPIALAFYT